MLRVGANVSVYQLIDPQARRHSDEEQGNLDGDREQQDHVVDVVDGAGRPDALERLPSEGLSESSVSNERFVFRSSSVVRPYLDQPPGENARHNQRYPIQHKAGNLNTRPLLPVRRQ